MWTYCEPGACVLVAVRSRVWEDFVDSAGWMLWWSGRQVPELVWVDSAVRSGLWGPLEDGLKVWLECLRKVVECHPALASVQVTCRGECVVVELVCYGGERWVGGCDAGWASGCPWGVYRRQVQSQRRL